MVANGAVVSEILFSVDVRLRGRRHVRGLGFAEVRAVVDRLVDDGLVPALHEYRYMSHVGVLFAVLWRGFLVVLSTHFEALVRCATVWRR